MIVFVRSNVATFGQNAQFSKKKSLFAPKNNNDQLYEGQKYNGLKEKIFTNKMMPHF